MTRRIAIALTCSLATGAALAVLPGLAWAQGETRVTYTGSPDSGARISLRAAAGQANNLVASARDANLFSFRDTSAGITAPDSPHCTQASPTEVRCAATGLEALAIDSRDKADRVRLGFTVDTRPELDRVTVTTGTGNDLVRYVAGTSDLQNAENVISGGAGNDRLSIRVGTSDLQNAENVISGGAGNDRLAIQVGTSDLQNAENVVNGGSGRDRLAIQVGTSDLQNAENVINAGAGNDYARLTGAGVARGQDGNDRLIGAAGNQRLFGGRGMDRITAGAGDGDHCDGDADDDSGGAGCETIVSL